MSARRALTLTTCLVFLLFFRSEFAFSIFGSLDPFCYVEHLYRMLGEPVEACPSRSFLPGTALLWLPGAALARLGASLMGMNVNHAIRMSIGFTAFGLWTGSLWLAHGAIQNLRPSSTLRSIFWTLSVPVLYYGAIRTTLSHAAEFFLACATTWLVTRQRNYASLITASLACLVRFNALPWLFIVAAAAWTAKERRRTFWCLWGFASLILAGRAYRVAFFTGYNEMTVSYLAQTLVWPRVAQVFLGSDWGILWTSPWWVMSLVGGFLAIGSLSWVARASLVALALNLLLCLSWRGNGGDFGYRYLIGTFPAALFLWPEIEARWPRLKLAFNSSLCWSAVWISYLTWIYRTRPEFTPHFTRIDWGAVLPGFQWQAINSLFDWSKVSEPLWRTPLFSLWCAWGTCPQTNSHVFGGQRLGLTLATAIAAITAVGIICRRAIARQ